VVEETGAGKYQVQIAAGGARFFADEPVAVGGLGSGPSPYQLVSAGLGACTAMTIRLYATGKDWPLKRVHVAVTHDKTSGATPQDLFERRICLEGDLDAEQTARLFEIADRCPVHRTLESGSRVETHRLERPVQAAAEGEALQEEHFHDMEEACRD
jgi:putative redox protein